MSNNLENNNKMKRSEINPERRIEKKIRINKYQMKII